MQLLIEKKKKENHVYPMHLIENNNRKEYKEMYEYIFINDCLKMSTDQWLASHLIFSVHMETEASCPSFPISTSIFKSVSSIQIIDFRKRDSSAWGGEPSTQFLTNYILFTKLSSLNLYFDFNTLFTIKLLNMCPNAQFNLN